MERIAALDSNLIKGLVEHLPAPGSVFPIPDREQWLNLVGMSLALIYVEAAPVVALENTAETAVPHSEEALLLEARPSSALGRAASSLGIPAPSSPLGAPAPEVPGPPYRIAPTPAESSFGGSSTRERSLKGAAAAAKSRRGGVDGKQRAEDLIMEVLQVAPKALKVKELVAAIEKAHPRHGFKNLRAAVDFQLKALDGRTLTWDMESDGIKRWQIAE